MLLEEAILHLLRKGGYRTVQNVASDTTLALSGAGICVKGRGGKHQIDAIADFLIYQPFSNPHRLLAEAKFYNRDVTILEIRNAVGVLKDVTEYWVPSEDGNLSHRFHYQYVLFSASPFSADAQRYAFAHDIYLVPVRESQFFRPIIEAIRQSVRGYYPNQEVSIPDASLSHMRQRVRSNLLDETITDEQSQPGNRRRVDLTRFFNACREVNFALLGVLGGKFPILLAPAPGMRHRDIPEYFRVRISWDDAGWYLRDENDEFLFSFDLPTKLLELYEEEGNLSRERALAMKAEFMAFFQAIHTDGNRARVINFELDNDWFQRLQKRGHD